MTKKDKTYSFDAILSLFEDYEDNDIIEDEIIEKEIVYKKRKKVVHRDVLKERKIKTEKRDYINKEDLFLLMYDYLKLTEEIGNLGRIRRFREDKLRFIKGKPKKRVRKPTLKEVNKIRKEIFDQLMISYHKIAAKFIKHPNFRGYTKDKIVSCEDLINDSYVRALDIGKFGNSNYGTPYFLRFNYLVSDNVFSFWTQQIGNNFLQYLNKQNSYQNKKWDVLNQIICRHNIENIDNGVKGFYIGIGDVVSRED